MDKITIITNSQKRTFSSPQKHSFSQFSGSWISSLHAFLTKSRLLFCSFVLFKDYFLRKNTSKGVLQIHLFKKELLSTSFLYLYFCQFHEKYHAKLWRIHLHLTEQYLFMRYFSQYFGNMFRKTFFGNSPTDYYWSYLFYFHLQIFLD